MYDMLLFKNLLKSRIGCQTVKKLKSCQNKCNYCNEIPINSKHYNLSKNLTQRYNITDFLTKTSK